MWILSTDGDFLQGKRIWLKPGKKYLFGRSPQGKSSHTIDNRTISRKHLVIEVGSVQPGDGTHLHTKSKLTVSDPGSRWGTVLDGKAITGQNKELGSRDEYKLFLGRYPFALHMTWCPVVLSFSFPSRQMKAKDPLAHARSRLENLDVKTVIPYVVGKTTHVVQNKRNTAKGLQALVNGKYLVQESYIEHIVYAATPKDLEHEESLSPLEEDFDAAWPDPLPCLPPRGREPTLLQDDAYEPDLDRLNVFEGYTFVFCDSARFEDLLDPISSGHGKALLYEIDYGKTTAEEVVDYMKKAAGVKGLAGEHDGNSGVMLVQIPKKEYEDWAINLETRISRLTRQKVVEPSNFLDAILRNDASQLYKAVDQEEQALPQDLAVEPSQESSAPHTVENILVEDSQDKVRPCKRAKTGKYVPRFKAFDDGFDMDAIPAYTPDDEDEDEDTIMPSQAIVPNSVQDQDPPNSLPSEEEEEEDAVAELLPGATAMKRRLDGKKRREPTPPAQPPKKAKRPKLDVKEAARQRREAEDEAVMARRQEEAASFQAIAGGMDLSRMQNLAIVEDITIKARESQHQTRPDDHGWDDRWNGRKNFKKFRRKGDRGAQHRVQAVIVPLEEVKRKDFGIGDDYWAPATEVTERSRAPSESNNNTPLTSPPLTSQEVPQSRAPSRVSSRAPVTQKRSRDSDSDDDGLRFRFRRKRQR